jgi:hypothetical protein
MVLTVELPSWPESRSPTILAAVQLVGSNVSALYDTPFRVASHQTGFSAIM